MGHEICGYLVVRDSKDYRIEAHDAARRSAGKSVVCYCGIDRDAWCDVMDELYAGTLPSHLRDVMESIDDVDVTGLCLCRDLDVAREIAAHVNRESARSEVIAVWSDYLASVEGLVTTPMPSLAWLGLDVVATGEWSLIAGGLIDASSPLRDWANRLSAFGLFDEESDCREFAEAYRQAAIEGGVEPTADHPSLPIDFIHVFRVQPG